MNPGSVDRLFLSLGMVYLRIWSIICQQGDLGQVIQNTNGTILSYFPRGNSTVIHTYIS